MKTSAKTFSGASLAVGMMTTNLPAQIDGTVTLTIKLSNYTGKSSSTKHWTVVWVTDADGNFIKTLRKQGKPSVTSTHWRSHCRVWWDAKDSDNGGNNVIDGYTSATTSSYATFEVPWDCRDKNNRLVADGHYRFYAQYAEDRGQGPATATAIEWSKGPSASSMRYPSQGSSGNPADGNNFTQLRVDWEPDTVAPTITSAAPPSTGTVGVPYTHDCTGTGTAPITFSATGLPPGLNITTAGVISGTPEEAGPFNGTITAANGTPPSATQPFSITVVEVPVLFAAVRLQGTNFSMTGAGPANGVYTVLSASELSLPLSSWTEVTTGTFNAAGQFSVALPVAPGVPELYYRLRIP